MNCAHEGSTHFACDCVLAQLAAADVLLMAARNIEDVLQCPPMLSDSSMRVIDKAIDVFRKSLDTYEKLRGLQ